MCNLTQCVYEYEMVGQFYLLVLNVFLNNLMIKLKMKFVARD